MKQKQKMTQSSDAQTDLFTVYEGTKIAQHLPSTEKLSENNIIPNFDHTMVPMIIIHSFID